MVYAEPKFLIGGDSFITLELGDDGSLHLNLYIIYLEKMIIAARYPWFIDTTSMRTTIVVQYDPLKARAQQVIDELRKLIAQGVHIPDVVTAKLVHLPVYYNDPITRDCAKSYDLPPNLELIAADNGISVEEVIRIHTMPRYFVSYICFTYGSFGSFPLDPSPVLKNSKYKSPRTWTPPGTLGIGGTITFFYPISSPGGLMMLGSIPCPTTDPERKNPAFKDDPLLLRPGHVVKFFPIDEKEYDYIKAHAAEYTYRMEETEIRWKE